MSRFATTSSTATMPAFGSIYKLELASKHCGNTITDAEKKQVLTKLQHKLAPDNSATLKTPNPDFEGGRLVLERIVLGQDGHVYGLRNDKTGADATTLREAELAIHKRYIPLFRLLDKIPHHGLRYHAMRLSSVLMPKARHEAMMLAFQTLHQSLDQKAKPVIITYVTSDEGNIQIDAIHNK